MKPQNLLLMLTGFFLSVNVIGQQSVENNDKRKIETVSPTKGIKCDTNIVTDIDGNVYKTVKIGDQTWIAENLRTTRYSDRTAIPNVTNNTEWNDLGADNKAYCYYNNDSLNGIIYGALYTWSAAMGGSNSSSTNPSHIQGVCPANWHLPSEAEWITLETFLGGRNVAGSKMKETGNVHWMFNEDATNESGFTALPAGYRYNNYYYYDFGGMFAFLGMDALWWATDEYSANYAHYRHINCGSGELQGGNSDVTKGSGVSVRCIKDSDNQSDSVDLKRGLIAFFPFNGNANDESGNNHNGVVDGAMLTTDRFGNPDKAYFFNGQCNSITAGGINIPSDSTTISCWVKVMNGEGIQNFISKHHDVPDVEVLIRCIDKKYAIEWTIGGTYFRLTDETCNFNVDENNPKFDFLILVYNGKKADFYVNAQLVASQNITGRIATNTLPLTFGTYATSRTQECYKGTLDEVRIYNRALNTAEIQALYNENDANKLISISTPDITAYRNSSFEIPVNVENIKSEDNAIAYQFDFTFDLQKMEYQNYSTSGTLSEQGLMEVNPDNNNLSVSWAGSAPISGSGILLNFQFKALENDSTIPVISNFLLNTDTIIDITNGTITIHTCYGDVDENSYVQAYDAALALQYSIGMDPLPDIDPFPWEDWRITVANVDGMDGVTAYDASLILQQVAGLINIFPAQDVKKLVSIPRADVSITMEDGFIVFRSVGKLYGLDIYANENRNALGEPQFILNEALTAYRTSETVYAVGMAFIYPPDENEILLKIPIIIENNGSISFDLIINNEAKQLTLEPVNGVDQSLNRPPFTIYPNPAGNILYIVNIGHHIRAMICDMQGNVIMEDFVLNNRIDISTLKEGMYIIRIQDNDSVTAIKLVKY